MDSPITINDIIKSLKAKANDIDVVHIAGDGNTPEIITGVKDFSYGHNAQQDDNNPGLRASRLRITGQVAPSSSQKSVSQVDFYLGDTALGYMGCTKQNNNAYLKVAAQGNNIPIIVGYLPYQDNTACLRFERNRPVWRGGQTGTYTADKAVAVVGDIKSGAYELTNKTIDASKNTLIGIPSSLNYSSTEIDTGNTLNGEKIYAKEISFIGQSTSLSGIDSLVNVKGVYWINGTLNSVAVSKKLSVNSVYCDYSEGKYYPQLWFTSEIENGSVNFTIHDATDWVVADYSTDCGMSLLVEYTKSIV